MGAPRTTIDECVAQNEKRRDIPRPMTRDAAADAPLPKRRNTDSDCRCRYFRYEAGRYDSAFEAGVSRRAVFSMLVAAKIDCRVK
jgi:hypothetical protein